MKISVITPFYKGNEYMESLLDSIFKNQTAVGKMNIELELILVNDSPDCRLETGSSKDADFIKIITNENNQGIHQSRVNGLNAASGDYILFLDQDDILKDDGLFILAKLAKDTDCDVAVGNALLEQKDSSAVWYRTDYHLQQVSNIDIYTKVGIQIISPGQCLIKKEAIPKAWTENICKKNGADDYYLWLLMLSKKRSFMVTDKVTYVHKYTGENLSADTTVTDASTYEFIRFLVEDKDVDQKQVNRLLKMIEYKADFRSSGAVGKVLCSIPHLDLLFANIIFKKKSKTALGFNR